MKDSCWDYIFLNVPYDSTTMPVPEEKLAKLRKEFLYWYPVDMRASGKDLLQNHLTFYLFNHVAIWKDRSKLWPVSIRANGHLLLNNEKMSKQTGNFMTLFDAVKTFSADGMRLSLADGGDFVEDANFVYSMADAGVLRLHNLLSWVQEMMLLRKQDGFRTGSKRSFADRVFENEMNKAIINTATNYEQTLFKEALKTGFFEYQTYRDKYRDMCGGDSGMHVDLVFRWIETQALILSPICPHVCEKIWKILGKEALIVQERWPVCDPADELIEKEAIFMDECIKEFRSRLKNQTNAKKKANTFAVGPPTEAIIYVAPEYPSWQREVLNLLHEMYKENNDMLPENKEISSRLMTKDSLKKVMKKTMPFVQMVKQNFAMVGISAFDVGSPFDQAAVLEENMDYILSTLDLEKVTVKDVSEPGIEITLVEMTYPGRPIIMYLSQRAGVDVFFRNVDVCSGLFSMKMTVLDGDTVATLERRMRRINKNVKPRHLVSFWRYNDPVAGDRRLISMNDPFTNKKPVSNKAVFQVDLNAKRVKLLEDGISVDIGGTLVYQATE